jgi:hypothetical protein
MPDDIDENRTKLMNYGRGPDLGRMSPTDLVAIALSVLWLVAVIAFVLFSDRSAGWLATDAFNLLVPLLTVFLPLALIWVAATTARTVRSLRDEAHRLRASIEEMRAAYLQQQTQAAAGARPSVERDFEEAPPEQRQAETARATFTSRRDGTQVVASADRKATMAVPRQPATDEQPTLALGTPAEDMRPPLSVADFVHALNFPESPEDKAGFRALRLALEDRNVAKLIRAAQDVLTLLSQDGIYMDDLKPDRSRPEVWRRFAQGERGRGIATLGGVRDRSSLALTAGRMRQDPVFRDAAHHFLRQFDKSISEFEKTASDQDMAELAETRTARAFMLFGRVTGTFD